MIPREQTRLFPDYRTLTEVLEDEIGRCDAVVHLAGNLFGSSPKNQPPENGPRSYTQIEYALARKLEKHVYVFLTTNDCKLDNDPIEDDQKRQLQAAHRSALKKSHKCEPLSSPLQLERRIYQLLLTLDHDILTTKIQSYLERLKSNPSFAEWNQQRYFELQLGREIQGFDILGQLKTDGVTSSARPASQDKYTVQEALEHFGRLVIIGEPGSGKTTALKRLALNFAFEFASDNVPLTSTLPIYIWLPDFNLLSTREVANPADLFRALILDALDRQGAVRFNDADLQILLRDFRLVLLLDGLNEIGEENINRFLDGLRRFEREYKQHLLVVSSRSYNFKFGQNLPVLELLELTYPDGIQKFIRCYFDDPKETSPRKKAIALSEADELMEIVRENVQLRQLAANPLLLAMTILVFKYESGQVPVSRGMLFSKCARGMLGAWPLRGEAPRDRRWLLEDKHLLLSSLGFAMKYKGLELTTEQATAAFKVCLDERREWFALHNPKRPRGFELPSTDSNWSRLIDELKQDHILFQTPDQSKVRFWHQTIQEYFAACYLWDQIQPLLKKNVDRKRLDRVHKKRLAADLDKYIRDRSWHEILAIACGLSAADMEDQSRVLTDEEMAGFMDKLWDRDWLLGALCLRNIAGFSDPKKWPALSRRVDAYLNRIEKRIVAWGIVFPRLYPWLLLTFLLTVIWIPWRQLMQLELTWSPSIVATLPFATVGGMLVTYLFFSSCAVGIESIERLTNKRIIGPGLSALRYIRDETAQMLLNSFQTRIKHDFSVGETTRAMIYGRLVDPLRDENELIAMLGNPNTFGLAARSLAERGSESGMAMVRSKLDQGQLGDHDFEIAVDVLVEIARGKTIADQTRNELVAKLEEIFRSKANYSKRRSAHQGLTDLGVTGLQPPQRLNFLWILAIVIGIAIFLILFFRLST